MENEIYFEGAKKRLNDEGEEVPEICDKCGSHIGVYLKGEPVYLCSDCKKYFGTVPCNIKESYVSYPDYTSGTSDFNDGDNDPDDCYCEYKSSLNDVKLSKIDHLYYWSPIRLEQDSEQDNTVIVEHVKPRLFVTDKIGLCPFYTLYDSTIFKNITKKYKADIVPVLPRDLDKLLKEEDITIKLISSEAKVESGEFNLYVYEVDKDSISHIKRDKKYKSEYLYIIPRQNGDIRISAKPVKTSHIRYTITPQLPINESFEEMFGSVLQETYVMEEKIERPTSKDELIPIKPPEADELYFGSPTNHMPEIDLNSPLFVTPFKGIASIFCGREHIRERIPRGSYNLDYKEWSLPDSKLQNPLKEVHVYVEGYPDLEPFTFEEEGYIHCIKTKNYKGKFFKKKWMSDGVEYLIANTDNMKVEFTRVIKCKVRYHVEGKPNPDGQKFGPNPGAYLELSTRIAKRIHTQVEKDAKPPVGNQNCLLCTWCAEAQFRGMMDLPRPVYSPRDMVFKYTDACIVKNPKILIARGYDNLLELLNDAETNARWYCHVTWKDSEGGHEFLLLKIDNKFYIMDAQAGTVVLLDDTDYHFKDIDWDRIFIARLDSKQFDFELFKKVNDPKNTLPWDPKKDIPYMVKHGMCTKEEAEKELKKNETNLFTTELKKALGQTPVQESVMGELLNGVNPWSDKLVFHISPKGYIDGQVFKPRVPEYLDKYDPTQTNFEDVDNPRVCFSTSIEGALNAILVNIGRWKTAEKLNDWYVYIPEKPLKNYKHSTNKDIIEDKKVFDANLTKEIWIEEPVRLKQYGIIRIDQVKAVGKRKTVPTINGEKGDRNYYSFKWHWLVRPSVLKNIPYDYSPIAVCNNMLDDVSGYKYGLGMNGSTHSASSKEYDEKYRLESPEEFEINGGGICYDFVEWQAGYLDAYGYTCKKYYISTETKDEVTHTFILVDDGKGEYIYPEAAFQLMQGTRKVKYPEEAVRMIIEKFFEMCDDDTIKYYVWEYSGHPPYGSTMKECTEYFTKGEPFLEGSMNKPEKIKRKD